MMRSYFIGVYTSLLCLLAISVCCAQKFGYIDSQFILDQLPEYKAAEQQLDSLAAVWQRSIEERYKEIERMELLLQNEKALLTGELIGEREEEIAEKREEAKQYQQETFGFEGLYFQKRKELVQEIQDVVFEAVERLAKKKKLQVVFDKSGDLVMIYTNPIHDYTEYVMEELAVLQEEEKAKAPATTGDTSSAEEGGTEENAARPPGQRN